MVDTEHGRRQPWPVAVLVGVVATALVVQAWPAAQAALEFHRERIAEGEWWRLMTGSLVHCDWQHLAADAAAFAVLCWVALRRSRRALWVVGLSAAALGAAVWLWADGIATYRGLSGVNYALLAWVLVTMAAQGRGWERAACVAVLFAVSAKAIYETATGELVVNVCLPEGIRVVAVAHVAGIATGAAMALLGTPRRGAADANQRVRSPRPTPGRPARRASERSSTVSPERSGRASRASTPSSCSSVPPSC